MSKINLTKIQHAVLTAAAHSGNLVAWPLPRRLKLTPGSTAIVIKGLLAKGVLEKRRAMGADPIWREEGGKNFTLVVSKAGLAACGIQTKVEPAQKPPVAGKPAVVTSGSDNESRVPRAGTKLAILVALLAREEGATIEEMVAATGWQAQSVRGVMSGMLAKKFGPIGCVHRCSRPIAGEH